MTCIDLLAIVGMIGGMIVGGSSRLSSGLANSVLARHILIGVRFIIAFRLTRTVVVVAKAPVILLQPTTVAVHDEWPSRVMVVWCWKKLNCGWDGWMR